MKNLETKLKPISSVQYVSRRQYHLPLLHHAVKNTWMQNLRGQMAARARHLSTL